MSINYPGGITVPVSHSFSYINHPNNFSTDHRHYMGIYGNTISSKLGGNSVVYLRPSGAAPAGGTSGGAYGGGIEPSKVLESVPVVQAGTKVVVVAPNKRQIRLFGVDMDCTMSESDDREVPYKQPSSSQSSNYLQLSVFHGLDEGKESTPSFDLGI
ncbi:hypothetical protein SAY86_022460 [Trapa natans]|uniref:Uncharacterized protein n=1 Tax=Trapa natans TaxID=22666 RepID=A0AAN7M949_TRANT|nr:hypothetical protein SAY86_022460 [Trapa natans]